MGALRPDSMSGVSTLSGFTRLIRRNKWEVEMRKEDRIRQQQSQNPSGSPPEKSEPRPGEHVKDSATKEEPNRPTRQPGKLPLPD
jgi:hypothetical protein